MVNTILKIFEKPPYIWVSGSDFTFPLARATGIPEAFPSPENPRGSDWRYSEPDWDQLRAHYGAAVYINPGTNNEWREIILTIPTEELDTLLARDQDFLELTGFRTDSFTVQAQRKGVITDENFLGTAIHGYTRTHDRSKLLIGTRGGSESVEELIVVPAGMVPFKPKQNMADTINTEGYDEAGISTDDLQSPYCRFLGAFRQEIGSDSPSNFFVGVLNLQPGVEQRVLENHAVAMKIYNQIKVENRGTKAEKVYAARQRLKELAEERTDFPGDAWENERLEFIANEPDAIKHRVRAVIEEKSRTGKGGLRHSVYGSLFVYFMSEFGQKEAEKLMDLPRYKDEVRIRE